MTFRKAISAKEFERDWLAAFNQVFTGKSLSCRPDKQEFDLFKHREWQAVALPNDLVNSYEDSGFEALLKTLREFGVKNFAVVIDLSDDFRKMKALICRPERSDLMDREFKDDLSLKGSIMDGCDFDQTRKWGLVETEAGFSLLAGDAGFMERFFRVFADPQFEPRFRHIENGFEKVKAVFFDHAEKGWEITDEGVQRKVFERLSWEIPKGHFERVVAPKVDI